MFAFKPNPNRPQTSPRITRGINWIAWKEHYLERAHEGLVNAHHGPSVVKLAAVVGGAEESHKLALGEELVTVLDNLVGTADEVHIMLIEESGNDIGAECERDTTVVFAPSCDVLVGVGPEQVAKQAAVGDLAASR